jgi:hypothetical protein
VEAHRWLQDVDEMRGLERRARGVDWPLGDEARKAIDFSTGQDDANVRRDVEAGIARFRNLVNITRSSPGGVSFAVAASHLVKSCMTAGLMGMQVNADEVVSLAEEAHVAAPSAATRSVLIAALLFRASPRVAGQEPGYADMITRAKRSLSPSFLLAAMLSRPGASHEAVLKDPDVQRALTLVTEGAHAFPTSQDPWEWAMLRAARPEEAAIASEAIRHDEVRRLAREIGLRLSPVDASRAFECYWALQMAGKEAEGLAILKHCASLGVPMPFEVP